MSPTPRSRLSLRRTIQESTTAAEECDRAPASVDLVNIANALHSMDGPRVMANIVRWLRPGAILAASGYAFPQTSKGIGQIIQEFKLRWEPFRDPRLRQATEMGEPRGLCCFDEGVIPNGARIRGLLEVDILRKRVCSDTR